MPEGVFSSDGEEVISGDGESEDDGHWYLFINRAEQVYQQWLIDRDADDAERTPLNVWRGMLVRGRVVVTGNRLPESESKLIVNLRRC